MQLALLALLVTTAPTPVPYATHGDIPAFARKYRTSCSTCHTAAPKLNVMGEAFRLNGYRFPENDVLLRREEPVPLGEDPWRDLWPRAIWPGGIPGVAPVAIRLQNDVRVSRDANGDYTYGYRFPHEVYLLAGGTLGETFSAFLETEWSREEGLEVVQAKVKVQNPIPWLPDRAANLWFGLQNLYLFTFADRQIDRAAREVFAWQRFAATDVQLRDPATGQTLRSTNAFQLRRTTPSIELNGLVGGRLYYGLGLAQGAGSGTEDNNNSMDFFYKVRYKLGGLGLDGAYDGGGRPVLGGGGQLLDRSLTIEHFGYIGREPNGTAGEDPHRAFGVSARLLYGPLDLGVGWVRGDHDDPWGAGVGLRHTSVFAKSEFMLFPWLIGSAKLDQLDARLDETTSFGLVDG